MTTVLLPDLCAGLQYENADPATYADRARNDSVRGLTRLAATAALAEPARIVPLKSAGRR